MGITGIGSFISSIVFSELFLEDSVQRKTETPVAANYRIAKPLCCYRLLQCGESEAMGLLYGCHSAHMINKSSGLGRATWYYRLRS
jgi:hypothetical protein